MQKYLGHFKTCQDTQTKSILKTPRQCSETGDPKFPICRGLRGPSGDASASCATCFANGAEGESSCCTDSRIDRIGIEVPSSISGCACCGKEFLIKHSLWNVCGRPPICQTGAGLAGKCHFKTAIESIHESLKPTQETGINAFKDGCFRRRI